jgi:hypothetical protein
LNLSVRFDLSHLSIRLIRLVRFDLSHLSILLNLSVQSVLWLRWNR